MAFIEQIPLSDVKVLRYLREAEVGTLVQVSQASEQPPVAALVSVLTVANGERKGFVILDGEEAGAFCGDDESMHVPALDISDLAHVAVTRPAPSARYRKVSRGEICLAFGRDGKGVLSMAVGIQNSSARLHGYVPLHGKFCGKIGNIAEQIYVGRGAVLLKNHTST